MNIEAIKDLAIALKEAKDTFDIIIGKMKANGINYPYESIEYVVNTNSAQIEQDIYGLADMKVKHDTLREENTSGLRKLKVKGVIGEVGWLALIYAGANIGCMFNPIIFQGVELPPEVERVYAIRSMAACGASIAMTFIGLGVLRNAQKKNPNIQDVPNELYGIKDDFKKSRAQIIKDIKMIQSTNNQLWGILEQAKAERVSRFL